MRAVAGSASTGSTPRIMADAAVLTASFEDGRCYYRGDEMWSSMPALLAVGALLFGGLLLAGRFAERGRDAGTG
jgi:hypothetical protein